MRVLGMWPASRRSLTKQQLEGHGVADYDLATGYPVLPLPVDLAELVVSSTQQVIADNPQRLRTPRQGSEAERSLGIAAGSLLGFPRQPPNVRITITGSVAIDRVFRALEVLAERRRSDAVCVITTEPSVDIARQILAERASVSVEVVRTTPTSPASDLEELISAVRTAARRVPSSTVAVFLASPENPTGRVWSERELTEIAVELGRVDGILVVDHCLLLAGVHFPDIPSTVWNVCEGLCDWVGIWDTGKTIDLCGDKLAFILTGGADVADALDTSLEVIQFGPSQRSVAVFLPLLQHPALRRYIAELGEVCRANFGMLRAELPAAADAREPLAGTVAWVDVSRSGQTGEMWRERWLAEGVATVAGDAFFARAPHPRTYLRVALARPEDCFAAAMARLGALRAA